MPDFDAMVRERLAGLGLSREEQEEVWAEIAVHLELCFSAEINRGSTEAAALNAASRQVGNWGLFRKEIQNTKGNHMRERLHRVWIPGVVVGVVFFLAENALMRLRWPQIIPFHGTIIAFDWRGFRWRSLRALASPTGHVPMAAALRTALPQYCCRQGLSRHFFSW